MKLLLTYLKPYKWLLALALLLAAINQIFSLLDPYFFGKMFQEFGVHSYETGYYDSKNNFIATGTRSRSEFIWGVMGYLGILISVAMISRIANRAASTIITFSAPAGLLSPFSSVIGVGAKT